MRTSRKVVLASLVSAVGLALAIPLFAGVLNVGASDRGNSQDVNIEIEFPFNDPEYTVFTMGGGPPSQLLQPIEAEVQVFNAAELTDVDFALNGELNEDAHTLTGADDVDAATLIEAGGSFSFWEGSVDLADGDFGPPEFKTRGLVIPSLVSSSIVRAFATVEEYYSGVRAPGNVNDWDDFDLFETSVVVFDAEDAGIDVNGDGKPDADGLAAFPEGIFEGPNNLLTIWTDLDGFSRGGSSVLLETTLASSSGDITLSAAAPNLASILLAAVGAYDAYDQGRFVLALSNDPVKLLDGPPGVDPIDEFNNGMFAGDDPPQNVFGHASILLRDTSVSPPSWFSLKTLPGGLTIQVEVFGEGITAGLAASVGEEVESYTYCTARIQDIVTGSFSDLGLEDDWRMATTTFDTDDRATVPAGAVGVTMTFGSASVIFGNDSIPRTTTLSGSGGGGSSGICFIATAAYGTPLADEIGVLRSLRDSYMLNNMVGTAFVDTYYRLSPAVADVVAHNAIAKALVRTVLVPVVMLSGLMLEVPGAMAMLLLVAFAFAGYRIRKSTTRS